MYSLYLSLLLVQLSIADKFINRHVVPCDIGKTVCECRETADECEFTLLVEELQTFTAYGIEATDPGYVSGDQLDIQNLKVREGEGKPFYINGTGHLIPSFVFPDNDQDSDCVTYNEDFSRVKCTVPHTVDGRTYRPFIAVNGQMPGPTLVVYENQVVVANIINRLVTETISIHWHGMDQMNTPWMDGAIHISQCPISPLESFRYYFKAAPSGTFWYHSHRVTQRADGLFGAFIVRESAKRMDKLIEALELMFVDEPDYTIKLHEWDRGTNLDRYTLLKGKIPYFPEKPLGDIPLPIQEQIDMGVANYQPFKALKGPDGLFVGSIPFISHLINGKGRNKDVPYNRTRLEVFNVESGKVYRFRLIGVQGLYAYKLSIDEHTLTVMSTDGSLIEPVEAQFVIVNSGERYDFLLKAIKPRENVHDYWIRAETLAVDMTSELPYPSLGHVAEAILHYKSAPAPKSTSYESIKRNSIPFSFDKCGKMGRCVAINCPFRDFHSSYNTTCINVDELRLLWPTPSSELPSADLDPDCTDCEHFFYIGSGAESINGRNMVLSPFPLQTQKADISPTEFCNVSKPCKADSKSCSCLHVREVSSFNKTIRFILSTAGNEVIKGGKFSHPMHLHGHHFHVVEIGYGSYHSNNGTLESHNTNITCDDAYCSSPEWRTSKQTFSISEKTVTKDTIIVPGGGYVVVHFRSNNPGFWLMHCHIISHVLQGMEVVINEVESRQSPSPAGFPTCGRFLISRDQYYASVAFDPDSAGTRLGYSWWLLLMLIVGANMF